jgi:hypothetical protein
MKNLMILIVLIFNCKAVQASYICTGKIDHFQVTASGGVQVTSESIFNDGVGRAVCYLTQVWKGVSPESCKTWVAMILAAEATGTVIRIQYQDELTCTTQPTWASASSPWMVDH